MDSSSAQVPKNVNEDISDPGLGNQMPVFAPHGMGQGVIHASNQGSSQDERRSVSNLERASCYPCCHVNWYHGWCRGMSYSAMFALIGIELICLLISLGKYFRTSHLDTK